MTDYTRLTIRGTANAADLVLPSDEPLAAMLPDVLSLLDEPAASARPLTLVTVLGEQLNTALSLDEQDVRQGAIVALVRLDEAPPPPEVADITQLAGESIGERADRWRREWAVLAVALATLVIGRLAGQELLGVTRQPWWLIGGALALGATAAVLAHCHRNGVLALSCGTYGNVVRLLPPLVISDELLGDALDVLAEAFGVLG